MKKKHLPDRRVTPTKPLHQDDAQKKREEQIEMNLLLLRKEFLAIGLPDALNEILSKELGALTGQEYVLDFDMRVGRRAVKGRVHLEVNGPGGLYTASYYELVLDGLPDAGVRRNAFLCTSLCFISIEEAVNLLQGRYIYRKSEVDPLGEGYWASLGTAEVITGFLRPRFMRNGFRVREYLLETGLGSWLGIEGWNKLVGDLEKGCVCDLTLGTGKGMRAVKVEADPLRQRLKVTNGKGVEVRLGI